MSRRKGRYQRRILKRDANKRNRSIAIGGLNDVFTYKNMYSAGKKCCNGVRWKNSTQRFEHHLFSETAKRQRMILEQKWTPKEYVHFTISERGKVRHIDAPRIQDRQVHKVFTKKVLFPAYQPSLIWNNGASLPGKGFHFSSRQLRKDLRQHFRKYGREGSVILMDFKDFFPSVSHEKLVEQHKRYLLNNEIRRLADNIIKVLPNGHGLPLGVEPSQAEMVAFPSILDTYIKCQLSMKCAGHYMDDYYIIVPPNKNPREVLRLITLKAEELCLTINKSKTRILSLTKPFRYCKLKYRLTETGRVVVNGNRDNAKRARRKIKVFFTKIQNKEMAYLDLWTSVSSIFAYFENYNDHGRVLRLRRLFYSLFGFSSEKFENFKHKRM